jgi:hypothetical protein
MRNRLRRGLLEQMTLEQIATFQGKMLADIAS